MPKPEGLYMNIHKILTVAVILATFAAAALLYPSMPATMVTHWGLFGEPNGSMSRFWGLTIIPLLMALVVGLFEVLPAIDPLRENYKAFRGRYDQFVLVMALFLAFIFVVVALWNLGAPVDIMSALSLGIAILFYFSALLISETRRNYFVGIRTPWTLASDEVWEKTHKYAGKVFKAASVLVLIGAAVPKFAIIFLIVPLAGATAWVTLHSYLEYKKLPK
jgi:uncharacterized membrane protein